jgi:hypothetical protein
VLGLANLSESDFARMDLISKPKEPQRLVAYVSTAFIARDILSKDGAIFIALTTMEQANL